MAEALDLNLVSLDGVEAVEWRLDSLFDTYPAAVVRPDKFIFGHTDKDHTLSDLIIELGKRLGVSAPAQADA
jgi:hypothetical protein